MQVGLCKTNILKTCYNNFRKEKFMATQNVDIVLNEEQDKEFTNGRGDGPKEPPKPEKEVE